MRCKNTKKEFKRSLLSALPPLPRVGDRYLFGQTVYRVIGDEDGWITMVNVVVSDSKMSNGIWGIYEHLLNGTAIKIPDFEEIMNERHRRRH